MDRYEYVYICGVGSGPKKTLGGKNFHLPLKYAAGEVVRASTYNGYVISAEDAVCVPIPMLQDGWNGRDRETTRCKNFQFAVAYFGSEKVAGSTRPAKVKFRERKESLPLLPVCIWTNAASRFSPR